MRWLGVAALGAVVAQGVLGGLTVLFFLPAPISTAHAGLAEIFFCLTVAIALFTSPRLDRRIRPTRRRRHRRPRAAARSRRRRRSLIYMQILVGATMRHTGAGLAIPDFPLMFGHLVPDHWSREDRDPLRAPRRRAASSTLAIARDVGHVWSTTADRRELTRPAALLVALVAVQVTLGALTVLSRRDVWINSLHVVCGALVLTTSLVLTLRTWRGDFATRARHGGSPARGSKCARSDVRGLGEPRSRPSERTREGRRAPTPHRSRLVRRAARRRRVGDYIALTKPRLNLLVVATSAAGYYLGAPAAADLLPMAQAVAGHGARRRRRGGAESGVRARHRRADAPHADAAAARRPRRGRATRASSASRCRPPASRCSPRAPTGSPRALALGDARRSIWSSTRR